MGRVLKTKGVATERLVACFVLVLVLQRGRTRRVRALAEEAQLEIDCSDGSGGEEAAMRQLLTERERLWREFWLFLAAWRHRAKPASLACLMT